MIKNPIKMGKRFEYIITIADIQIANKHKKICLPSLVIREMQIKVTMRYYFTHQNE